MLMHDDDRMHIYPILSSISPAINCDVRVHVNTRSVVERLQSGQLSPSPGTCSAYSHTCITHSGIPGFVPINKSDLHHFQN